MYKVLFTEKATATVESVKEAFKRATGESDWGYDTPEDIAKGIEGGWLEFDNGTLTVYVEER